MHHKLKLYVVFMSHIPGLGVKVLTNENKSLTEDSRGADLTDNDSHLYIATDSRNRQHRFTYQHIQMYEYIGQS
jgi:hypothetical protein